MAGLDPAIHAIWQGTFVAASGAKRKCVDTRVKPGHDEALFVVKGRFP